MQAGPYSSPSSASSPMPVAVVVSEPMRYGVCMMSLPSPVHVHGTSLHSGTCQAQCAASWHVSGSRCCFWEQMGVRAKPLLPSQQPEKRVVALQRGRPALLSLPGPNPANENSAALVYFQVVAAVHSAPKSPRRSNAKVVL